MMISIMIMITMMMTMKHCDDIEHEGKVTMHDDGEHDDDSDDDYEHSDNER